MKLKEGKTAKFGAKWSKNMQFGAVADNYIVIKQYIYILINTALTKMN